MVVHDDIEKAVSLSLLKMQSFDMLTRSAITFNESKIIARNEKTASLLARMLKMTEPMIYKKYLRAVSKYGLVDDDFMNTFVTLCSQFALGQSEMLKKFLKAILDPNLDLDGKKVSKINMYGELIDKLTIQLQYKGFQEFGDLFNNKLRNALAHDDWWHEKGVVYYRVKEDVLSYDLADFAQEIRKTGWVTTSFLLWYMQHFAQQFTSVELRSLLDMRSPF